MPRAANHHATQRHVASFHVIWLYLSSDGDAFAGRQGLHTAAPWDEGETIRQSLRHNRADTTGAFTPLAVVLL